MKRLLRTVVLLLAIAPLSFTRAADDFADIQQKIVSYKLDNGLTIILYARPAAPVISCVTYVKAGSVDEHVGITGIAHQLEHLAFKGTPFIGTKNFAAEQKAFTELDGLYEGIQAFDKNSPPACAMVSYRCSRNTPAPALPLRSSPPRSKKISPRWPKAGRKKA